MTTNLTPTWLELAVIQKFKPKADADIHAALVDESARKIVELDKIRDEVWEGGKQGNDPSHITSPEWRKWLPLPYWTIEEAAALSMDWEPADAHKVIAGCAEGLLPESELTKELIERIDYLGRYANEEAPRKIAPSLAANVARHQNWDTPDAFSSFSTSNSTRHIPPDLCKGAVPAQGMSVMPSPQKQKSISHKLRQNSLDAPIEKAIRQAGVLTTSIVFIHLRELAINETRPFTGKVEGDALFYTDDNNKIKKLTKDALKHRLKNYALPDASGD